MFKTLALSAALASGLVGLTGQPARALDALKWAEAHPEVTILSSDELLMIEAPGATLEDFRWTARALVVFADSENDPRFIQQMEYIAQDVIELAERDVIVVVDTDPAARSAIRLDLRPNGFTLVLVGKDGFKYLSKPLPWDVREISRSLDQMPLRKQELKDSRGQ